jgi:hypothetical protein
MDFAKNYGFLFLLPIAVGLLTWLLDRGGATLPNWLISLLGCVVFGAVAYGIFYPLQGFVNRTQPFGVGTTSYNAVAVILFLCVVATAASCWWVFGRPGTSKIGPAGAIKTELRLQFYGDTRIPTEIRADNIYDWYTLWSPHAEASFTDATGKVLSSTVLSAKSWNIFVIFETPTRYRELSVSFSAPGFPQYEVKKATERYAIINVQADIPAGALEIYAKP